MKKWTIACIVSLFVANMAFAADESCEAKAVGKNGKPLAGAAKTAFIKKCEKETAAAAKPSCEAQAKDKKLAGAAKSSFVKKCEKDAAK